MNFHLSVLLELEAEYGARQIITRERPGQFSRVVVGALFNNSPVPGVFNNVCALQYLGHTDMQCTVLYIQYRDSGLSESNKGLRQTVVC